MNAPETQSHPVSPASDGSALLSWAGHMADDVAATYGPEPLAHLSATAEFLSLSSTRGNFRLPRASVTRLGRGGFYPWFFSAMRIHHDLPALPRSLQFKPLGVKPAEVMAKLRALGYPVT